MKITRRKVALGIVLVLAIVIAGSLVVGSAFAAPPSPTPPANGNYGYGYGMGGYQLDRVAKLLGTSTQDLIGQLQQGKTLVQVGQDKGVTEQQLVDTLIAPQKDELQLRVKYGYISQDQADSMVQQMTNNIKTAINSAGNGSNYGYGCGGFGGMMGGFGGMMGNFGGMMGGFGSGFRGMMGGAGGNGSNGAGFNGGYGGMMGRWNR